MVLGYEVKAQCNGKVRATDFKRVGQSVRNLAPVSRGYKSLRTGEVLVGQNLVVDLETKLSSLSLEVQAESEASSEVHVFTSKWYLEGYASTALAIVVATLTNILLCTVCSKEEQKQYSQSKHF